MPAAELFFDPALESVSPAIHRRCVTCSEIKTYVDFHRSSGRGSASSRKTCAKAKVRAWYSGNRDRALAGMKSYLQAMPSEQKAARSHYRNVFYKYGITPERYSEMLVAQGGVCAICKLPETRKKSSRLSVDHGHVSGKVRGLLCHACNTGIGKLRDDPTLIRAAADYVERVGS